MQLFSFACALAIACACVVATALPVALTPRFTLRFVLAFAVFGGLDAAIRNGFCSLRAFVVGFATRWICDASASLIAHSRASFAAAALAGVFTPEFALHWRLR